MRLRRHAAGRSVRCGPSAQTCAGNIARLYGSVLFDRVAGTAAERKWKTRSARIARARSRTIAKYVSPTFNGGRTHFGASLGEVLGVERVGVDDNFFLLGGDSIKSIQIVARLARHKRKLKVKHFMLHPTIAELAPFMERMEGHADAGDLVVGEVPLTPVQRWFFAQKWANPHHWNQAMMLKRERWDAQTVEDAFQHLVRHHDALRMRFYLEGSEVRQRLHRS